MARRAASRWRPRLPSLRLPSLRLPGGLGRWWGRRRWWSKILWGLFALLVLAPLALTIVYRVVPVPATPLMVLRLFEGEGWHRDWVAWDDIAPVMGKAAVAAEDNLFCRHDGFDWVSMRAAWDRYRSGVGRLRGGSTISNQTAKNVFLWDGRTFIRKGFEAYLTVMIEALWPKRRIMEVYLNVVELGPGIYGVEAASQAYFGKSAAQLSAREASLLAAVLPNPRGWSAGKPSRYVAGRAATIQRRIGQLGDLLDCLG
ncbi:MULTISPECIES: monofunctional biosynthetic peptidoglycan transglycosylase [Inquilinus]|jgi:monofunctional biosynthetic peptidoglycan transglycosylase|uniref:Biosynthetic peptidoglycan transglycosylase n=1 Tax=Inquilinus ginsengisoli TaxID=363840 RepID=A0ABU1JIQ1_9PROT|nr:monofunctional biosynthetic peptidoglycan transglycosylase [Inquilinus ginsengisoli]MDR6288504.1 monofunctional biosynthetic peptidoglycan transglycosylase [Inquilinus ginsengisoli]